jgi:lipopolysaccharide transport system ATP-binding protein
MIIVENLTKEYVIKHQSGARYTALRDVIVEKAKNIFKPEPNSSNELFRALNDVSFEVKQGERVGIIGRNGAGKSTLLKILSRIVTPTRGIITIDGRVASLLEVGTGFHAELSGRENIFLNGAILGMSKAEIQKNFDAIVDFSGVEKFLDTPVKRYSSGMYVRLAFAVAAHLEPEILIVDEVLAVGDAEFQKKCIGKMKDVSNSGGRTVLFVSHNMEAIQKLCNQGIFLQNGGLKESGSISHVIKSYMEVAEKTEAIFKFPIADEKISAFATELRIENELGHLLPAVPVGAPWQVRIKFQLRKALPEFVIALGVTSPLGLSIRTTWTPSRDLVEGEYEAVFYGDDMMLTEGLYSFVVGLSSEKITLHYTEEAGQLTISEVSGLYQNDQIVNTKSSLIINQMRTEIIRN